MAHELKDEDDIEMAGDKSDGNNSFESDDSDDEEIKDFPIETILFAGLWAVLFGVFSFGFDMDPDTCIVSNKDDLIPFRFPLVDAETTGTGDS